MRSVEMLAQVARLLGPLYPSSVVDTGRARGNNCHSVSPGYRGPDDE